MRWWVTLAVVALSACDGGGTGTCTALADGTWTVDGTAIGMAMTATVTMDPGACTFTFSEWSMAMAVPEGGVIDGDAVTLSGDGFDDCVGEIAANGTVEGTCGDGGTFSMAPR
jgi:hypothetical protein